jgi:hypothetical protein
MLRNEGRMKIDFTQGMPPEAVAAKIVRALQKNRRESVLGWDCRLMLRINRFFPWLVDRLLARRVRQLYAGAKRAPAVSEGNGPHWKSVDSDRTNRSIPL